MLMNYDSPLAGMAQYPASYPFLLPYTFTSNIDRLKFPFIISWHSQHIAFIILSFINRPPFQQDEQQHTQIEPKRGTSSGNVRRRGRHPGWYLPGRRTRLPQTCTSHHRQRFLPPKSCRQTRGNRSSSKRRSPLGTIQPRPLQCSDRFHHGTCNFFLEIWMNTFWQLFPLWIATYL